MMDILEKKILEMETFAICDHCKHHIVNNKIFYCHRPGDDVTVNSITGGRAVTGGMCHRRNSKGDCQYFKPTSHPTGFTQLLKRGLASLLKVGVFDFVICCISFVLIAMAILVLVAAI